VWLFLEEWAIYATSLCQKGKVKVGHDLSVSRLETFSQNQPATLSAFSSNIKKFGQIENSHNNLTLTTATATAQ
jgi:hypothetical protein